MTAPLTGDPHVSSPASTTAPRPRLPTRRRLITATTLARRGQAPERRRRPDGEPDRGGVRVRAVECRTPTRRIHVAMRCPADRFARPAVGSAAVHRYRRRGASVTMRNRRKDVQDQEFGAAAAAPRVGGPDPARGRRPRGRRRPGGRSADTPGRREGRTGRCLTRSGPRRGWPPTVNDSREAPELPIREAPNG